MRKIILFFFVIATAIFSGIFLSTGIAHGADAIYSIDEDNSGFGGAVDFISADKMAKKYSPINGILDVNTDRYNEITKKYGSTKYNTTATDGSLKHRRAYTYNQADGDSYIITQTGAYLKASKGDGSFSTVISTLTATIDCDFTTANDKLYFANGTDTSGSWNGSILTNYTVANSTYYPTRCKYIANFRNRNWQSGDSTYPTRVYYTEAFALGLNEAAYEQYLAANFIDCGTSDGDTITGLQVVNGKLYVYFRYKIFEITELATGIFGYTLLSDKIGCLYNTTLGLLNNMPVFLSHRGVEQFDGANFKTVSMPIDNYVRDLRQMKVSQSLIMQSSAEDWGAGTEFVNIDTTTVSGSVVVAPLDSLYTSNNPQGALLHSVYTHRQLFVPTFDIYVSSITMLYFRTGVSFSYSLSLRDADLNTLVSKSAAVTTGTAPIALDCNQTLSAGNTYYLYSQTSSGLRYEARISTTSPFNSTTQYAQVSDGSPFIDTTFYLYADFNGIRVTSASFTSKISTATGWGSWGNISINDSQPTGSSISYYVKTSTANDNFSTRPGIPVTNGSTIGSSVGNYIQLIASYTRTSASVLPQLDDFTFSYYGSDNNYPQGKVYDDRYYLAVNTGPLTMTNDVILVMQKNGDWTRYSNKAGCFTVHRDNLYYGDSQDSGFMYKMEVPNLYTDNGNTYTSKWTSKKIGLHPFYKNNIKELWVTTDGTAGDINLSYNFDDSTNTWTDESFTVSASYGTNVNKLNILPFCYTRYFQFSVGNSTANDFRIKRLDLLYDDAASAE